MPQSWRQQISICDGVAAMAIAGVALAARVAALGEGVGRIERRMGLEKLQRETAATSRAPRFSIAKSHRDGGNHAPRALDALEACSKKLDSYLILHGRGNNHRYDGAKKHRVVTPRFSIAPSTHALTPTGVSRHHPFEI